MTPACLPRCATASTAQPVQPRGAAQHGFSSIREPPWAVWRSRVLKTNGATSTFSTQCSQKTGGNDQIRMPPGEQHPSEPEGPSLPFQRRGPPPGSNNEKRLSQHPRPLGRSIEMVGRFKSRCSPPQPLNTGHRTQGAGRIPFQAKTLSPKASSCLGNGRQLYARWRCVRCDGEFSCLSSVLDLSGLRAAG